MKAVFLGGSRLISHLDDAIRSKLDNIVTRGLWIFIGDANGADRALQQYLAERAYARVVVYSVTGVLRNNVGHWEVRSVDAPGGARGFAFYSAKDTQMAKDASYGLMLWDGKSRGTLENVRNLVAQRKPVAVYLDPVRRFVSLKAPEDLYKLAVEPDIHSNARHGLAFDAGTGTGQPAAAFGGRGIQVHERSRRTRAAAGYTRSRR